MKTDETIQRDVVDELAWDPKVDSSGIGVTVRDGIVTLTGTVSTYADKYAAEKASRRIAGVKAVADELQVRLVPGAERGDAEIARSVVDALRWNVNVPHDKVSVVVENGWVKLEGEVPWFFQKKASEDAVRFLTGVRGVANLVVVKQKADVTAMKHRIEDAFKRSAEIDAANIRIEATDGKVVLSGAVRAWAERDEAEDVAWSAPGVTEVKNEIVVEALASAAW